MLRIALSTVGSRKGGLFGALAAVGLAVVLVVSCGILIQSTARAPIPVERLRGAAVVVQASSSTAGAHGESNVSVPLTERRRLAPALADRIRDVPGVAAVVADRSVYATAVDRHTRVLTGANGEASVGHGWESAALAPYVLAHGHAPVRASDVVVDTRLASRGSLRVGDSLRVETSSGDATYTVAGIAGAARSRELPEQAAVFFRTDVARALSGAGASADLLGVVLERTADPIDVADVIRARLHSAGLQVFTGDRRGDAEFPQKAFERDDIVDGLTVFALMAAFVAVFVVASTLSLSVQQRHRELALLRAIGGSPRQVRRLVAAEALVISVVAAAFALPLSVLAALVEKDLFVRAGMLPSELTIVVGWLPLAAGVAAAIATTQVAAFTGARRAARIRPVDALREASVRGRPLTWLRGVAGVAALAGGVAVVVLASRNIGIHESDAPAAAMVLMVAAALLGPAIARPFAWLAAKPLAVGGSGPGILAWANTRANLRRSASVATPLMLAVSVVSTMYFGKALIRKETHRQTDERTTGSFVLRADEGKGISTGVAAAARRVPAVAEASGTIATSVAVAAGGKNLNSFPARAVDAASLQRVLDLGVVSGSLDRLHGRTLAVSTQSAREWGWHTGDRVDIRLGDGTAVRARVVAEFSRPLGFGEVVLPRTLVAGHVTQLLDDAVFVTRAAGSTDAQLEQGLRKLSDSNPTVRVDSRADYASDIDAAAEQQSLAVYVLLALIVAFCALALVNALSMAIGERTREFAMLRLIGATKRQVRSMVRTETVVMIAFGLTTGSLIAAPGLALLNDSLTGSLLPAIPVWSYAALGAFYTAVGLAAIVVPTRLSLRANPVAATAYRE